MAAVENVRDNGDCLTLVISQLSRIPLVQNSTFSLGDAGSTAQLYVCLRLRFRCPSTTPISSLVVPSPPPTRLRDIVGEEGARAGLACSFFSLPFPTVLFVCCWLYRIVFHHRVRYRRELHDTYIQTLKGWGGRKEAGGHHSSRTLATSPPPQLPSLVSHFFLFLPPASVA